jgi:hypothetical protein
MSLILRPDELLSSVISAWLTLVNVDHVDGAFCKHELRKDFLKAAY